MAGAASALFLLDIKGRVLVWRDYRGDVTAAQAERFFTKLIEKEGDSQSNDPVAYDNGVTYMFVQHSNIYLMIASRQNCNAASLLFFLHRVVDVFKHYFEELEEESLRDNFVVVYELLDEMMDFGYPQYTEARILSEFIKTDAYRMEVTQRPPMAVTNAVSWRSEGLQFKKNEVFLDVIESVNILVNSNGQIVRSDVVGALKMRTYLSGMPECKLGLNDRVLLEAQGRATKGKAIDLEDIKFHQCVRLARFENDRTISFIPPDGSFDLMTYRLSTQVKPLIWVEAQIERHSRSRVEMLVKARSQFKERSTATNVEIELPVPTDASNPNVRTSLGSAAYAPEKDALVWKIKSFPGNKEYMLRAEFHLPSITAEEATPERKAPIRVKFEIPYFTVSGIQVRYLKIIEKSGYQALPWVRYITMAAFCGTKSLYVARRQPKNRVEAIIPYAKDVTNSFWDCYDVLGQSFSHMKLLRMEKKGGIASVVASCSTHPLHLLKVRMQLKGDSNPLLPSIPRLLCFCPRASFSACGHNRCIIRQEAVCALFP
ncbi:unnamed protein product [Arabidopsis arenosa]|uniref:MHD domain-containing protein n=1 Tax=Arabidopsis arenosa TaxID=38785 RepID=A0A8S1ZF72_ARAAE|nr:unnamed protein product [Arabidopsis arenosa]